MRRLIFALIALSSFAAAARAQEEDVRIRGNFPQVLARGETVVEMANRIAALLINLDRKIAPPCGMKRIFEFAGADHFDADDLTKRTDPGQRGVWRIMVTGKGCWAPRMHNVFLYPVVGARARLVLGVPGRSVAGVRHQGETTALVLREANGIAIRANCDEGAFIVDTALETARKPGQPWTEYWSASACEVTRRFMVMFAPEGPKMRIAVALAD